MARSLILKYRQGIFAYGSFRPPDTSGSKRVHGKLRMRKRAITESISLLGRFAFNMNWRLRDVMLDSSSIQDRKSNLCRILGMRAQPVQESSVTNKLVLYAKSVLTALVALARSLGKTLVHQGVSGMMAKGGWYAMLKKRRQGI